jgi:hypothetical protein
MKNYVITIICNRIGKILIDERKSLLNWLMSIVIQVKYKIKGKCDEY